MDTMQQKIEENQEIKKFPERFKNYLSVVWEFLKIIIVAAIIVLPIRYYIFQPFIVKGESMEPNFHSGDYLIVDQISYRLKNPDRGDVVVFRYPLDLSQRYIKRIIGLPGETVEVKNGQIIISKNSPENSDGEMVLNEEKYLNQEKTGGDIKISLSNDEYFVLGDNRQFSYDSRRWGVLPKKNIIGRAALRVFPVQNILYIGELQY